MPFDLSPLTVEVEFMSKGRVVYTATTFAGYTGILTGMRHADGPRAPFSLAINFRGRSNAEDSTALRALVCGGQLVGQATRRVLEHGPPEFEAVVQELSNCWLLAPCYISVVGSNHGEAVVLTRGRRDSVNPLRGANIQANMEHWKVGKVPDFMNSSNRVNAGNRLVAGLRAERVIEGLEASDLVATQSLWRLLSQAPITHTHTIYANVMCAAREWFETRVHLEYAGGFTGVTLADLERNRAEQRQINLANENHIQLNNCKSKEKPEPDSIVKIKAG